MLYLLEQLIQRQMTDQIFEVVLRFFTERCVPFFKVHFHFLTLYNTLNIMSQENGFS